MTITEIYDRLRDLLPFDPLLDLFELREKQGDSMYMEIEALAKAHYELGNTDALIETLALIEQLPIPLAKPAPPELPRDSLVDSLSPVPYTPPLESEVVGPHYHVNGRFAGETQPDYPVVIVADDMFVVLETHGRQPTEIVLSASQAAELGRHLTAAAEATFRAAESLDDTE